MSILRKFLSLFSSDPVLNKRSKSTITAYETLQFSAEVQEQIEEVNQKAKEILKENIQTPENMLHYIVLNGTPVYRADFADIFLKLIDEEEGFVFPVKGWRAIYITIMINIFSKTKIKISSSLQEVFILRNLPVNVYIMAHQLHRWMGFKKNLPGYERITQEKLKRVMYTPNNVHLMAKLSPDELFALKDAIRRDVEAIDFVKNFAQESAGAKDALDKIKDGDSINL
jgi:hypothetical protein